MHTLTVRVPAEVVSPGLFVFTRKAISQLVIKALTLHETKPQETDHKNVASYLVLRLQLHISQVLQ